MPRSQVSVCIPARDHARFIAEAIASALTQEGVELEVLVHDDASTDATAAIVAGFDDARLRYRRHPQAVGVAANRNGLVAASRGAYLAWLDADDAYLPGALARQVGVLERNPGVALVHGGFEVIGEDGRRLRSWPAPFAADAIEPGGEAFRQLLASNEITTSTVVVRRSRLEDAGPFSDAAGRSSSDWDMWLRLALRGDVAYSAAAVARYRQHSASISHATARTGERLRCDVRVARGILRREVRRMPGGQDLRAVAHAGLATKAVARAGDAYSRGERRAALAAIALAVRLAPHAAGPVGPRLAAATLRGDDLACLHASRAVLARLARPLARTRHGRKIEAATRVDPDWQAALARIAAIVRRVVPADADLATVAKWDPTLLELSGRRGRQFPDLRRVSEGYPREDAVVIGHLEAIRREGVSHIVFPSASFWWLDHYEDFARHLRDRYATAWQDDDCAIYDLRHEEAGRA
jgi:glycosyltransferase involved in cell wall biosynthesis